MIMMQSPSLAINSCDAPWPRYKMWATVNAGEGFSPMQTVEAIIRANQQALREQRKGLANVIINCHGAEGGGALYIGGADYPQTRINDDSVGVFALLKPHNIGTLWLVACQAARGYLGRKLCQSIATLGGLQVVASDEDQDTGVWGAWRLIAPGGNGQIDEFEGDVYSFTVRAPMSKIDPHEAIFTIME